MEQSGMEDISKRDHRRIVSRTSKLAAAYLSRNALGAGDVPKLIADIHAALAALERASQASKPAPPQHGQRNATVVPISRTMLSSYALATPGSSGQRLDRFLRRRGRIG
jgi:predicted transcriptional regulator